MPPTTRVAPIVQSAGNGGADAVGDADTPRQVMGQQLVVAASDEVDLLETYSNFGRGVDLVAPGGTTTTTWDPAAFVDAYAGKGGTSISAATVSGVAALIWSANPTWSRDQVVARLFGTATNLEAIPGNQRAAGGLGHGLINAAAAVNTQTAIAAPTVKSLELFDDANAMAGVSGVLVQFSQPLDPSKCALACQL